MTLKPLALLPLIALAACSTPQERCIGSATGQLRTLDRLIATTQGNINRGYALVEVEDVHVIRTSCEGHNEDGTTFRFPCEETQTHTRREPVSINVAEERVKLEQLMANRSAAQENLGARVQSCRDTYPE